MTASALDNGRKCWLKVWYDGVCRKVEWNTSTSSFALLEGKVKEVFHVGDKIKLSCSYVDADQTCVAMSSDEELSVALQLLTGDFLTVKATQQSRKKKGVLIRAWRAVKAQQPRAAECLASLALTGRAILPSCAAHLPSCTALRATALGAALRASASIASLPRATMPSRRMLMSIFFLVAGLVLISHRATSHSFGARHHHGIKPVERMSQSSPFKILAATYGGLDVTKKLQDFVNAQGAVVASNYLYGDPTPNSPKRLHVVYQYTSPMSGVAEVFSQSFPEAQHAQSFSMARDNCAFPEHSIVGGSSVKVLGALYEDVSATCSTRRFAASGRFSDSFTGHRFNGITKLHFGDSKVSNGVGAYTVAYLKDNKLKVLTGRDGHILEF